MNTPIQSQQPDQPAPSLHPHLRKRRGVALILVIAFIVLISALVIGFFSRVTTELSSARSYAEGVNVRQLADSAVAVVMGQIRNATTVKNGAWASQPGMIRVYRTAGGQAGPNAYAFYKLYSSHDLIVSTNEINKWDPTATDPSASALPIEVPLGTGGWQQQPAYFTDLNAPVDVPDPAKNATPGATVKRYPIFDPTVAVIYDPNGRPVRPNWTNKVEGAEIELLASNRKTNDAPMPVRWMYVLKDGTLTAPTQLNRPATGGQGLIATWSNTGTKTGVPTRDNPIVGRIGFWADDDSCKVNVNTAGGFVLPQDTDDEDTASQKLGSKFYTTPSKTRIDQNPAYYAGSFWDTPRIQSYFDRGVNNSNDTDYRGGLSNSQPGANEFQRYPGHPCTTSLGLVFANLLPAARTGFDSEKLYAMTPRLMPGGSQNGTVRLETKFDLPLAIKTTYLPGVSEDPGGSHNLNLKAGSPPWSYHLLGSVDELFYTAMNGPRRSAENGVNDWAASQSWTRTLAADTITPTLVDKTRFFLTANSRSPELNMFGRPRVTMWPVPTAAREAALQSYDPPIRNAKDDLIRFCSTVGDPLNATRQGQFIFDRQDPYSSTFDLMGPGKNGANWRNFAVFNYLKTLSGSAIPGFGGNFQTKYAGGAGGFNQILVEIFDYIRTVNQKDGSRDRRIDQVTKPQSTLNNQLKATCRYAPHALVVPTRVTIDGKPLSGFGRYSSVSEATLVIYHAGYVCIPKGELAKQDLPKGGSARVPGEKEVVIYDLDKSPGDIDPATGKLKPSAIANGDKSSAWAAANVEKWTGQIVRAFLVFETFNPMQGYAPVDNFASITMWDTTKVDTNQRMIRYGWADPTKGVFVHELRINTQFSVKSDGLVGSGSLAIGSGVSTNPLKNEFTRTSGETWGGRNFGGTEGIFHPLFDHVGADPAATNYYAFQSPSLNPTDGVRVGMADTDLDFLGGNADLLISYRDAIGHKESLQVVKLNFKPSTTRWPMPTPCFRQDAGGFDGRLQGGNTEKPDSWQRWSTFLGAPLHGGWGMGYHLPSRIGWTRQHSYAPWTKFDKYGNQVGDGYNYSNRVRQILQPGDTIRSLIPGGDSPEGSDPRIVALQQTVTTLVEHPDYYTNKHRAETLRFASGGFYFDPSDTSVIFQDPPGTTTLATAPTTGSFIELGGSKYKSGFGPDLPRYRKGGTTPFIATRPGGQAADYDTGIGSFPDGAFTGKADEGNVAVYWVDIWGVYHYVEPYFSTWEYDPPLDTYFSPNRQIPGPVMFGSLPAPQGPWASAGWKTLLFCPNPASVDTGGAHHDGLDVTPPDHLILDLFNMPVVEPYAISEPFSSGGKVNLNYQLMPFGYIKRTTALRAALHSVRMAAIPQTFVDASKQLRYKGQDNTENLRYLVDREETLKGFDSFFAKFARDKTSGFFKSASQICERFLYPKGTTVDGSKVLFTTNDTQIRDFWLKNKITGDNLREKPYGDLYPRVTTKSNTFTVHYRVQTLRQRAFSGKTGSVAEADHYRQWNEADDQVLSELRGHTTIERYLDPEDPRFDPASTVANKINVETQSLEDAYRFRIVANKRFMPW